ncbi:phospholipase D family protein [uncultured Photobacterium sp.]|uniref:phospholipase D family protein n=1 Tax=uncultured Photobacterium sp. TaxID=173973 RepID=UPI002609F49E|nr:phospholipase D family protein [uncultured Photobacterium sp.]
MNWNQSSNSTKHRWYYRAIYLSVIAAANGLSGCNLVYWDEDFDSYHELSKTNPYPYHQVDIYDPNTDHNRNEIQVLNSGVVALQMRIDMIRRAEKSIDVEYFIFSPDLSGKIIVRELVAAAKRGITVRILIDKSATVFEFDEFYAQALQQYNIEVRYYNAAPIYYISTINFRNHRKLLVVDDREAITGGRNIENDYFDLSTHYNFLDRDLYIEGSIVAAMAASFDAFYEHSISERFQVPQKPTFRVELQKYERRIAQTAEFLAPNEAEQSARIKIEAIARPLLLHKKRYLCPETTFTTDAPGGSFWTRFKDPYSDNYRFLRKTIFDKVMSVDQELILASPYLLNNRKSENLMQAMLNKQVKLTLYTNSLSSTDASYVAAQLYQHVYDWQKLGITTSVHAGEWIAETDVVFPETKQARWGMHAKTQVYKRSLGNEVMVGTYNIDNRSNHYNTEMGLFCKGNDELVQAVESSILSRAKQGYKIVAENEAIDHDGNKVSVYGAGDPDITKMKYMWLPSWMFNFLL